MENHQALFIFGVAAIKLLGASPCVSITRPVAALL